MLFRPSFFRLALPLLIALGAGESGLASPPKKADQKSEHGAPSESENDREIARSIELGGLVFPVFNEKDVLQNYIFVNARMVVAPGKDPWKYREKAHFIRDAVLRAAHRTSFNLEGTLTKLDEKRAAAECVKASNAILGEDAIVGMTFTQIDSRIR